MITHNHGLLQQIKDAIRHPIVYGGYRQLVIMADGEILCSACTKAQYREIARDLVHAVPWSTWHAIGVDAYWEGPDVPCGHCGKPIPSEYGDPNPANQEATP